MNKAFLFLLLAWGLGSCEPSSQKEKIASVTCLNLQWEQGQEVSGNNAYLHTKAFCEMGNRLTGSPAYEKQLLYLEEKLKSYGWQTQRRSFSVEGQNMVNLYASFPSQTAARPLLLSCHIDCKAGIEDFVGANDGASGAAALLEIARMLSFTPEQAEKVELVFFDGEEALAWSMTADDGLYGSKWDAARREAEGTLPRWQINLDMVGGRGIAIAPPMMDTSEEMYQLYSQAVNELALNPTRWTMAPSSYMDDHQPYLKQGVDSLNLIGLFTHTDWWHTAKDDMSLICPNALHDACLLTLKCVERLLELK